LQLSPLELRQLEARQQAIHQAILASPEALAELQKLRATRMKLLTRDYRRKARLARQDDPTHAEIRRLLSRRSISEIARLAGISSQHLGKILRGHRRVSLRAGLRLARVLGITPDALSDYIERVRESTRPGALASLPDGPTPA
jgi:transcriptional regulator with XRE-family HTH domain